MQHRLEKINKALITAAILLVLALVSFMCIRSLIAGYKAETGSSDSARVAVFKVTESGTATQHIAGEFQPGDNKVYDVVVTNESETAVDFTITAESAYDDLPLEAAMLDSDGNEISKGSIAAGDKTQHTYTLKVSWPKDKNSSDYAGKADMLTVTLDAKQVD